MIKKYTFLFSVILLFFLLFITIYRVFSFAGSFIYPLDDAYIHLSIAKNFAKYNVWGITQYEFSSTTSSPFFTLLLSILINIFGNWQYIPIVANTIAAVGLVYTVHRVFYKSDVKVYVFVLLALILLMPLHTMVLVGMEHVFHVFLLLLCILVFKKYCITFLSGDFVLLNVLGFLSVGFRYESLFFIIIICLYFFFIEKKHYQAVILGLVSIAPVVIYGFISVKNGSYFLPNSLILKGNINSGIGGFLMRVAGNAYRSISILPLVIILITQMCFNKEKGYFLLWIKRNKLEIVILLGFCIHLSFANFGWLVRYEAYLVALLIVAIQPFLEKLFRKETSTVYKILFTLVLLIPINMRLISMLRYETVASKNIYDQQIQMARFLNKYYDRSKIIANDIGAITYFTNIHLLDTFGLGSIEIAEIRKADNAKINRENKPLRNFVEEYSKKHDYDIAIVYNSWLRMPNDFQQVGSWEIENNYICGNPKVSFYVIRKNDYKTLVHNLEIFNKQLPKDIKVSFTEQN